MEYEVAGDSSSTKWEISMVMMTPC